MGKHKEEIFVKMQEIYNAVIKRIKKTGKVDEVDVLFIHLYKTEFEQNTNYKENNE